MLSDPWASLTHPPKIFHTKNDGFGPVRARTKRYGLVDFMLMVQVNGGPVFMQGRRSIAGGQKLQSDMGLDKHPIDAHLEDDTVRVVGAAWFGSIHVPLPNSTSRLLDRSFAHRMIGAIKC